MKVYALGVGTSEPTRRSRLRLEEMIYQASAAALDQAGVSRSQMDHITIAGCDELDGRPISSMLMTAPAGGYLTDEIKVTDSGASALVLEAARLATGEFELGLAAAWCKPSKTDVEAVMLNRADPFFYRPVGIGGLTTDGMFAQAVMRSCGLRLSDADERTCKAIERASGNPRGMRPDLSTREQIAASPFLTTPVREAHVAPYTDGAVSILLASERFLETHREVRPLARLAGIGWCSDGYQLDAARLRGMNSAKRAWSAALRSAGLDSSADVDFVELDTPTIYHELAYQKAFDLREAQISPSGGSFSRNPLFCTGLENAADAIRQVAGLAGPVQRAGARRVAAHGCHGFAQQGNVVALFEGVSA